MSVRSVNLTKASARLACFWLMQALALPCLAHAQGTGGDSAYTIGPCHIRTDSLMNWDAIASHVDRQARLVVAGKAVSSLTEQALSYNVSGAPGRP